ncbi:unnamed protein product [Rotaria sp. Silwood1]|nr:unnamed protein product [Rotaria sp. Silwood1]CAF3798857.1 unnamed protein product [Rotaria sp. Silwood1]CAF5126648.1 unnamed protein product [Rotaria sp. Silwood1]
MAASKRFRQRILIDNKNFSISPRTFIETLLTPTINVSQITENHLNISNNKEPIQTNQLVDIQQQRDDEFGEKSKLFQNNFEIISKTITNNKQTNDNITKIIVDEIQNNNEDDWV